MGYQSHVTGQLTIRPQISEEQIEKLGLKEDDPTGEAEFVAEQHQGEEEVKVVDGELTVVGTPGWTTITPRWEEPYKAYGTEKILDNICTVLHLSGHSIEGFIMLDGEEQGDVSRLRWDEAAQGLVGEKATMHWPDGTPVQI